MEVNETKEVRLWNRFKDYFLWTTGVDLSDEEILKVNPTKISISEKWNEEVLKKLPDFTDHTDRVMWGLLLLNGSPKIVKSQEENVIFEEGAVLRKK